MRLGDHWLLLPVGRSHHPTMPILHHFLSEDGSKLVIYLRDTTFNDDWFPSGFIGIGDRQLEGFYLTTLYHEWFIIDYDPEAKQRFGTDV